MRVPGVKTARHAATWLRGRFGRSALILGYHRVAETAVDPFNLCVSPAHFAEHLDILRQITNVVDLEALQLGLQTGDLPRRAVAITFDDGYQDNLTTALPLLAAHELPATLFVIAGALGRPFWWDELSRLVFGTAVLPEALTLQIGNRSLTWSSVGERYITWRKQSLSPRQDLFQQLYGQLRQDVEDRTSLVSQLQTWAASSGGPPAPPAPPTLTPDELKSLAAHPLITIGAHTITHPQLSKLLPATQSEEIQGSKTSLETLLNQPVTYFSYPHGDNPPATRRIVQNVGYHLACTSEYNVVRPSSNLFALPRLWPANVDGDRFGRWLSWWLERGEVR
jgi:peptidoglycan/xylan/chitin deacetylase (PgdA/CDA1 family)